MTEDAADDLLRDVTVDQPGAEGVAPLVRGQLDRAAVRVADVAAGQPAVEREPVGRGGWSGPGRRGSSSDAGTAPARPRRRSCCSTIRAWSSFVDRDQRLAFHLVVEIAQVGGAVGVEDHAVARQAQRVGDPQPGPDQDQGDQPVGRVGEPGEVVGVLDLGHHVLGQRAGRPFGALRDSRRVNTSAVAGRVSSQWCWRIAVQERVELPDLVAVALPAGQLGVQVGQVALQHLPGRGRPERSTPMRVEEDREPGQGAQPATGDLQAHAGAQPPPQPSLDQHPQPRLRDRGEAQRLVAGRTRAGASARRRGRTRASQPPAVGEVGDLAAGSISNSARAESRGAAPIRGRHCCSVPASSEPAPVVASSRTTASPRPVGSWWSADQRGAATRTGPPDFSCPPSRPNRMIWSSVTSTAANRTRKSGNGGRPAARQVLAWAWQNGSAACGHNEQPGRAQTVPSVGWLDRERVQQPGAQLGAPGAGPPLGVQLAHPLPSHSVAATLDPAARVGSLASPPGVGGHSERRQVRAVGCDPAQVMALAQAPAAGRADAVRDQAGAPPKTGSAASNTSTSARNGGRTTPTNRSSSPAPPGSQRTPQAAPPSGRSPSDLGVGEPARPHQRLTGVLDAEVTVGLRRGGHRGVPEQLCSPPPPALPASHTGNQQCSDSVE